MPFTPEELAAMRAADAEIEAGFSGPTLEERRASDARDAAAREAVRDEKRQLRREQSRRFYEAHREECRARSLAWYNANKEHYRQRRHAYYVAHKEEALAYNRAYYHKKKREA
jgi:hypothetical protein